MKAFLWIVANFGTVFSLAKETVTSVQAIGNYLKTSNEDKKEVAVTSLSNLIYSVMPVDKDWAVKLRPVLGWIIELALTAAKKQHDNWEEKQPGPQSTVLMVAHLIETEGPEVLAPVPEKLLPLAIATNEFLAIEERNRLKNNQFKENN